jgi:capsular exopolysaccharide synthesis family protein
MDSLKNLPPQETKLHFLDYWRIIRIRKAIIITVFLITAIIATVVTLMLPESYSSTARIKVEQEGTDIQSMGGGYSAADRPYDPFFLQTTFEIIGSEVVLSNVINGPLNLNEEWGKKYFNGERLKTTETMELLKQRMHLDTVRNTKLIAITVYSDDKDEAARLANAIATGYQDYRLKQSTNYTAPAIHKMEDEFNADSNELAAIDAKVNALRAQFKIHNEDPNASGPTPTMTQEDLRHYGEMLIEEGNVYKQSQTQLAKLQAISQEKLRDVLPTVLPAGDAQLSGLLDKLHETQQNYALLTNDYALGDLHITRVQSMIDTLNGQIDARVDGIMAGLQTQVDSQKAKLDDLATNVEDAKLKDQTEAADSQPFWDAKRDYERKYEFHRLLALKIEQQKVDISLPTASVVEITDTAQPGQAPVRPKKALNIGLGLVFGLLMGLGLAFFIEYLDTSVKTIDDVERAFQAPVLGVIPQNVGYLLDEGPESKYAEAYRVLRTNILFSRKDDKLNSIVVVSAGAGEGKSTTTMNLATVFAQTGQRVLMVDSDLRRPTLHKLLHVGNNIGLTNYLLKQKTLEEVVQTTSVPRLDFMASGKLPNSSMGVLGSAQMREMIAELKQRYDFIFFDSPPILGVSDASVLASEVDLVVQVIQYRRYPQPMNIRAKQMIEKVGGNFVGIVLNNINMSQDESYYYYSGYYHDYYETRAEDEQEAAANKPDDAGDTQAGIKQKY